MPERTIRVLIIDDDEDDFFITTEYIKQIDTASFKIEWCPVYQDALKKVVARQHDIYFVDYRLGAKTGLDLLKEAIALKCEEPIVLLTGKGNQKVDKEAMEEGAFDYLIKSELNTEKLERCIRYSLERAASVKALRANERKYRNVFEKSKDAIFITYRNLQFKDLNLATSELIGYNTKELLNLNLYDLIVGNELKDKIADDLDKKGDVLDLEIVLADSNNEIKNCILSMSLQNAGQEDEYIQGIIHDITNLKKAEKVTLQAEKLAAAGRLVRTLAHEVRNPLSNIQMSVEQLESTSGKEDDKVFLEIINRNSKRINALITELLNSSRPAEMSYQPVSLQHILDATLQVALDRMTLKQIHSEVKYPDEACMINADVEKLKIAFLNIIINATEAITGDHGLIRISVTAKSQYYIVEVKDNGCGIEPENLSKLFEPYFTSKRNGMGLGLASTLNIIQSHQGIVDVKSQINSGTTFIITFPKTNL
ncbi:MAG: hybrid sensor histidine kinase/response regulator [Azospira oryzae]|jgi:PAS domain S-box-containing protein|nr:MAG: hybrid sensor histidine kinase/response regulator [Azospira oryzae]